MGGRLPAERCPITNKVCWPDEDGARREAKYIRKHIGPRLKAYHCIHCDFWHIGHWRPPHRRGPSPLLRL
jgi:hypothetical protein